MAVAERFGDDEIMVDTTYQDRHIMTQIAGARYDRERGKWLVPLSWQACVAMRGLFGHQLTLGDELTQWAWEERQTRVIPAMDMRDALEPKTQNKLIDKIEANHPLKLFPYQRVDAEFISTVGSMLLANEPGLGKTGATIRSIQLMDEMGMNPYPVLVVCPNSLKYTVWRDGFELWAPGTKVSVVDGSATKRRQQLSVDADVYVINWDSLRIHSRLAPYGSISLSEAERAPKELNGIDFGTVVMDEAHKLKDPVAKQTRATWAVSHKAKYRIALTGTPIGDNIGDLWSILHAIHPSGFPRKSKFMDRYALRSFNAFGGTEVVGINPGASDELFRLIDPIMRRVPKKAALPQLPEKLPVQYRHTPMTPKQQKAYDEMAASMVANLNQLLVAPSVLAQLARLAQFAAASAEVEETTKIVKYYRDQHDFWWEGRRGLPEWVELQKDEHGKLIYKEQEVPDIKVTLVSPSSKVDDMVELLEEMGDKPLVVCAVSRQLIYLASKKLTDLKISHGLITGMQSSEERAKAVDDFQAGRTRVILFTLGAGGVGITLTRADTILFMQRSWSEIENLQAEDRVHRIGSEGHAAINIIEQITPDTVEEHKINVLASKRGRMEEIVRDEATLLKLLGGSKKGGRK